MKILSFHSVLVLLIICSSCKSAKPISGEDDIPTAEIISLFKAIPENPSVLKIRIDTFIAPVGGHIQGIQQLDKKHLVVSGSSDNIAYFFTTEMSGMLGKKRRGVIKKLVNINEDFPGMLHNHASGIQLDDNLLAIGTEGSINEEGLKFEHFNT